MKLLTLLIYTLLITCMLACGPKPSHKRKMDWKKHKIEQKLKKDTIHTDSMRQERIKKWKKRKKIAKDTI